MQKYNISHLASLIQSVTPVPTNSVKKKIRNDGHFIVLAVDRNLMEGNN